MINTSTMSKPALPVELLVNIVLKLHELFVMFVTPGPPEQRYLRVNEKDGYDSVSTLLLVNQSFNYLILKTPSLSDLLFWSIYQPDRLRVALLDQAAPIVRGHAHLVHPPLRRQLDGRRHLQASNGVVYEPSY